MLGAISSDWAGGGAGSGGAASVPVFHEPARYPGPPGAAPPVGGQGSAGQGSGNQGAGGQSDGGQGDRDGHTRPSGRPRAVRPQPERKFLRITAVRCPSGHANPPYGGRCRVCDQVIEPGQKSFEINQPQVGQLRHKAGGATHPLRGRVLIGREPRLAGRETALNDPSDLADVSFVAVDSPDRNVSRTHLELRVTGWAVEAIHLGSSDTEVTNPGREPVRMVHDSPIVILPGAEIVLGGEIIFVYEVSE